MKLVHSWMHHALEVRGGGVFAAEAIRAGERLAVFGGRVMQVGNEPAGDFALQIDEDLVIGAGSPEELCDADFFNHSCDPNAGVRGQIVLVAMRDIGEGEEVCFDYATVLCGDSAYGFDCRCGAESCRGRVTEGDWQIPELRRKYEGWFSRYIEEKIRRRAGEEAPPAARRYRNLPPPWEKR